MFMFVVKVLASINSWEILISVNATVLKCLNFVAHYALDRVNSS